MSALTTLLNAAHILLDTGDDLHPRLVRFYAALGEQPPSFPDPSLTALQLESARSALLILHRVQLLLDDRDTQDQPAIGTRDLNVLKTLLTLLFRWGINPLLAHLAPLWRTNRDPPDSLADLAALSALLSDLMSTLFPRGVRAQPPQTLITTTILHRHVPDLLMASMTLAWLPKSPWPQDNLSLNTLRPFVLRLLEFLPLSQIMTDLGAVLSSTPPPPSHVRKLCSSLLTKSLLRPEGVRALFAAVFGEQEGSDDPPLEKYERTAGILVVVPAGLKPEEYFATIIPRLMELLSNGVPASYRRAAAFSISRLLDAEFSHRSLVSSLVSSIIHRPIIHGPKVDSRPDEHSSGATSPTPTTALSMLTILLLNTDPSPAFITDVLSPVVPALYALIFHLDTVKASDPVLKDSVNGLLATWGRVVGTQDGLNTLWSVIRSERIYWEVDISGIKHGTPDVSTKRALLTPEDIMGENFLDLYPDPAHFVQYIKSLDRLDMASELFVRLLEVYHSVDAAQDAGPSRGLLYLQLIIQMQTQLSNDSSPTNILRKPEHILLFIKHALGPQAVHGTSATSNKTERSRGLGLEDLKIVDKTEDFGGSDSDDDLGEQAENSMSGTAIDLLLAILEANPELSARNAPVLNEIFSLLEPFTNDVSDSIRSLAREARMVMTARLASGSTSWSAPRKREEEDPQEIYQKALKLLQDPILPVRAHGLLLLRQLVSSRPRASRDTTDAALVPAILSIFMQSVQEDDSYIFLNAVQGLSAMVDAFGKDVLGSLLETYTRNLSASSASTLSKQEVDAKVRVGEALGQVIRRCGDALGVYADIIVPRLISVFRASYAPTVLRTSAVSLLTQCVTTSTVSVLCYINDLATGMIDLFQVEMVSTVQSPSKDDDRGTGTRKAQEHDAAEALDTKPTVINPKLPPLRRAALHFWTSLLHQLTHATYDGTMVEGLPATLLRRAKITLGYIAATDEDGIVRVMAREASEAIDQLNKATLGI
ncbi:hypothetical protein JVT61DRAFT_13206 [Boletus reticuloceps]|uniref:RNA polymerase II assembly factor Rtp1 C-terminal domain-containing protein n=1 Tax=Boletus reticuloceps TaxID=495285 RepID=A0A8I3AE09_9AGAM|nr:hypothetical protein JVT61DRAFT_13206 [Boletus reticuloceps]